MVDKYIPKYPLIWGTDDFFIKIFCSIPNIATGIILKTGKTNFVIDPGDGILRDLNKEIGPAGIMNISHIFISHGHHDHVGGVWSLFTYLSVMNRTAPLHIHYPKGCKEIESIHRAFHEVYGNELTYKIHLERIVDESPMPISDLTILPFHVNHREKVEGSSESNLVPSLGFKFVYKDQSICYGGDTAYCDKLVKMVIDSDLAIIEAGAADETDTDLHMTQKQAIEIGRLAKEFFLVHVPE